MRIQITPIHPTNRALFLRLLPTGPQPEGCIELGCIADGCACGTLTMHAVNELCSIDWLLVAPDYRAHGCGRALLAQAAQIYARSGLLQMTILYPQAAPWSVVLDYLLWRQGFFVHPVTQPVYRVPLASLLDTPAFAASLAGRQHTSEGEIYPLEKLPPYLLRDFHNRCRAKRQYISAQADFEAADPALSMALIREMKIEALLLLQQLDEDLHLTLLHVPPGSGREIPMLMLRAADAYRASGKTLQQLVICCADENADRLAARMLQIQPEECRYQTGILMEP